MNLVVVRGDSQTFELTFTDDDGDPLDLTDGAVVMTVEELFTKSVGDGITVSAPLTGVATVAVAPADTADCPDYRQGYRYDVQVTLASGVVKTPIRGRFVVLPDVTT